MATKTLMTGEELLRMPEPMEGTRYELVRGELRTMPPTGGEHAFIEMDLGARLRDFVKAGKLGVVLGGEPGFYIERNPDTVIAPDIAFLTTERWASQPTPRSFLEGAPDLAVEIVSPSDTAEEVHEKALRWLDAGVRLLLVVHPLRKTVTVYTPDKQARVLEADDILDGGDVLPGFAVPVREIFE